MSFEKISKKNLLLLAAPPSPNGRLHLGHIGGPYLKIDIIARHYKQNACTAVVLGGNDCFDSYVLLKAFQERRSPTETTNYYHDLIITDLKNMDIYHDDFINPLEKKYIARYENSTHSFVRDLINTGQCINLVESFPYCEQLCNYLPESFTAGYCANCRGEIGGLTCEKCGMHYKPQDILSIKSKIEGHKLSFRNCTSAFLNIQSHSILEYLNERNTNKKYVDLINHYFSLGASTTRLTIPGTWGIKSHLPESVYYSFGTIFSYYLLKGEVYAAITSTNLNAFDKESGVTIVATFGKDNCIVYLVDSVATALAHAKYKCFDKFLINEFYTINGDKFSTSRGTAIWVRDIIDKLKVSSDIVRAYLSFRNADNHEGQFQTSEFIEFNNKVVTIIQHYFDLLLSINEFRPSTIPSSLLNLFQEDLTSKNKNLDVDYYDIKPAIDLLWRWLFTPLKFDKNTSYWWLKSFAVLNYPIMPKLAMHIWTSLGHVGLPNTNDFLELSIPRVSSVNTFSINTLTSSDLPSYNTYAET